MASSDVYAVAMAKPGLAMTISDGEAVAMKMSNGQAIAIATSD